MSRWSPYRGAHGPDPRRDVDEELSFHVEMLERRLIAAGETPERARELARRRFGNYTVTREECIAIDERHGRRMARTQYAAELGQDIGYALRALVRTPGFTIVAVLTLALGIGANSAIFSVVNGVLLDPLPYRNADRLHVLHMLYPDGAEYDALSAPDFMSVAAENRVFEDVVAWDGRIATLQGLGEAREVRIVYTSRDLVPTLGLRLVQGRAFDESEHVPGQGDVVILSHGFWQREFGAAADALGRTLTLSARSFTIVGILDPDATLPGNWDLYAPLEYDETFDAATDGGRRSEFLFAVGVARAGMAPAQVGEDMRRVGALLAERFPATNARQAITTRPLRDVLLGDVRRPLLVLLGAVGLVLLVACANVANLMLARASARQSELAVRAALGAGRGRLLRQLLTESVVLGALGGVAGLVVAWLGTRALIALQPADIPRLDNIGLDATVVLVTLGVALLTGLLFGAAPAVHATRRQLATAIREGGRGQATRGGRLRSGLIVAEMALAVVLLVGAGLLIRSFVELTRVDAGFESEGALSFRLAMAGEEYQGGQQIRNFVNDILEQLAAVPGVTAVGGTSVLPLSGLGALVSLNVVDAPPPPDDVNMEIALTRVTPGYFEAIGAPVLRGRGVTAEDHAEAPPVALINEAAARFWFPGEDPIGRRIDIGVEREVVGIVSDVRQRSPAQPAVPVAFVPYAQSTLRTLRVVVRTSGPPLSVAPAIHTTIRAADPGMPISDLAPLRTLLDRSVAQPRFYTSLLTIFAAVALVLAAVGIFGVMSYSVAQRAREISVRMALGARSSEVTAMVVRSSMLLSAAGLVIGIAGALAMGRVLASQLYNVSATDPLTILLVGGVLLLTAAAASWLPARRAAALDPGEALRGG
jgi:putative ABC transport system permease protein